MQLQTHVYNQNIVGIQELTWHLMKPTGLDWKGLDWLNLKQSYVRVKG